MMKRRDLLLAAGALPGLAWTQAQSDYWFIFLETGKPTPPDKEAVTAMQRGHIDNFKRLHGEGKLFAAGPMRDPAKLKRGIVVARAPSEAELASYFQPDEYVREGYMTLNARRACIHKPLRHEGIDPNGIEEVRILMLSRDAGPASPALVAARHALLQRLVDSGLLGAWYTLADGPIAEIAFSRNKDDALLSQALAAYPGLDDQRVKLDIWGQWLGKGVVA